MASETFVRLAFPIPVEDTFWYRVGDGSSPSVGMRVEAPLGRRKKVTGYVVEIRQLHGSLDAATAIREFSVPLEKLRNTIRTVDSEPLFDEEALELASWLASMYHCALGEALSAMLPTARRERDAATDEFDEIEVARHPLVLTEGQRAAIEGILQSEQLWSYLYGPTGTGKTEVFLQLAERTLAQGRSVLYLVPEIALTRQVEQDVRARFGERCAIIHSRLSPGRKLAEWRRIQRGEARMVVGARSAVFAPLHDLGLVIIDEEHDTGYKSGTTPRYHARQVAMFLTRKANARLVMGSATPSLEAWHACKTGAVRRFDLSARPGGGAFPSIHIVDMRGCTDIIAPELAQAMRDAKAAGRQSILFLNRRGFARTLVCDTCGADLLCRHCSVPLTYHKRTGRLVCHYCGFHEPVPTICPACGSLDMHWATFGTERVEETLAASFPGFTFARLDTDTASRKGVMEQTLSDFAHGSIDVLVGTQMVAKGLNFPGVRVVGILMADQGLAMPDFRASERVFSLLVQVAGRAGRHRPDGEVYIQTRKPDSDIIRRAASGDVSGFLEKEIERRRQLAFPPHGRLCRLVLRSRLETSVQQAAEILEKAARRLCRELKGQTIDIFGPAECPLGMIADNYRMHLLLRSSSFATLQAYVHALRHSIQLPDSVYLEIDIDPQNML